MPDHPKHTPAEAEAELVRRYKQQRPLQRPPTHAGHLVAYLAAVECGVAAVAMAVRAGLAARGIACSFTLLHALAGVAAFVLLAKPTLRLGIRLYQHYAPENVRRRCTCMPSCSEYALMVLDKYNTAKALRLIYIRLTRTCPNGKYVIDYP